MDYSTIGVYKNHIGRVEPICIIEKTPFEVESNIKDRLRLILIKKDSGIIKINKKPYLFYGPSIICINEIEIIDELTLNNGAICLYFNPTFITPSMTLSIIRKPPKELSDDALPNRLLIWPFVARNTSYNGVVSISESTAVRIENILKNIQKEIKEQSTGWWPCKTRGFLTELLFLASQFSTTNFETDEQVISNAPQEMIPILSYLLSNYQHKISINDLTKEFSANRTSLNDKIKRYTGLSAIAYLIRLRLRISALLIKNTDLPLTEIIEKVGFEDLTHFGRLFKKTYKKTPSDFKKSLTLSA